LFAGPIFSREALTLPRQLRHYLIRSGYVAALFVLMYTAGQAAFGWQQVRNIGDIARFGSRIFQIFSLVQLSLVLFFALLFAAGRVAQEKDRQTLTLLLMTDLRDRELVLGKLWASLLMVAVLLAASAPVFILVHLLGGVSLDQIGWSLAICASTALAAGSWGSLVAYWREKTFQTLAFSVLGTVLWLSATFAVIGLAGSQSNVGQWAALLNPYCALVSVLNPLGRQTGLETAQFSALGSVLTMVALSVVLSGVAVARLRAWNPTRAVFESATVKDAETKKAATRNIWSNPVIWREIRTRAYGHKVVAIKIAYVVLALFAGLYLNQTGGRGEKVLDMISPVGFAFVVLSVISLMLINAQAVTALTSERDTKTLELLLVTDISAKEFIYGKLGGILYNTKELIFIPLLLAGYYVFEGRIFEEKFIFLVTGFLMLVAFASMLGLHSGLSFDSSRSAIATSLGTIFFLFIGIFIFMLLLVGASSSFFLQFQSFIVFIGAGSIGLYAALTYRNPSREK